MPMRFQVRRHALALAPWIALALAGSLLLAWLGLIGFAWNDYDAEAAPAYALLVARRRRRLHRTPARLRRVTDHARAVRPGRVRPRRRGRGGVPRGRIPVSARRRRPRRRARRGPARPRRRPRHGGGRRGRVRGEPGHPAGARGGPPRRAARRRAVRRRRARGRARALDARRGPARTRRRQQGVGPARGRPGAARLAGGPPARAADRRRHRDGLRAAAVLHRPRAGRRRLPARPERSSSHGRRGGSSASPGT